MSNIIKVRDNNGNWLGIPALKGVDGITPHIGENGNWFIGADDTGVAAGGLTELPIASADTLGAVKIGNNLTIDENGVLNGNDVDLTSYAQKSELPTKVSDLTNDSLFITNTVNNLTNYYTKTETYTQEQINSLISAAASLKLEVVSVLPTTDISTSTIYLKGTETTGTNDYEEWIYVNNNWELIGTTAVDLTSYATKTYVGEQIAGVTKSSLGLGNVENKSSATIRGELTSANVTTALGFTPTSLALGETSSTAYRGDRGKTAYDHSQVKDGSNPHATTFTNIASKPTTISGYGITDAKIANGVITLGSNTITPLTSSSSLDATKLTGTASINTTGKATTAGTADALKNVTATATELNILDGATLTTTELNYVDGVTSNIQTQLNAKAVKPVTYTATIPTTGWSSSAPYYVDVTITGILATDTPNVTPTYSDTLATDKTRKENWNKIDRIVTYAGKIRVYAFEEKPTTAVPIQLVVVR